MAPDSDMIDANKKQSPVEIRFPTKQRLPLVVASPHSGHCYPDAFIAASRLDPISLRRSEDAHVHILCGAAPALGAPLVHATFPRAYLDVNREPYELDPAMFEGPLPDHANTRSPRVAAGLGTIARIVANGWEIYRNKLTVAEAEDRLDRLYRPYHKAVSTLIEQTEHRFGYCILIDCHSMPSGLVDPAERLRPGADFVLGDCHGTSCNRLLTDTVQAALSAHGYHIARNVPYAGGYTTRHYGIPGNNVHVLQLEISRHLYMNERTYEPLDGFTVVSEHLTGLFSLVGSLNLSPSCGSVKKRRFLPF